MTPTSSYKLTTWPLEESDWAAIRAQYLNAPDETYLNTGSWGVMPRPVFDSYTTRLRQLELNPTRGRGPLRVGVREAREAFGRFVNVAPEDLAFLPNVTAAINVVINGLDWEDGDEILTTDQEYGAILNCLHNASVRSKVTVVKARIPVPPDGPSVILDAIESEFTPRTRLVVCSHITTRTGIIAPIKEISKMAHERGVLVAFDGAHAPGMIPLDIGDSGADFYGGNCHKWLCSPKGVGFLYADPKVQEMLHHLIVSWGYDQDGAKSGTDRPEINGQPFMQGIETWGTTDLAAQSSVGDAVRFQEKIGIEAIAERGRELSGYLRARIDELDWAGIVSPSTPGMYGSLTTCLFEGLGGRGLGNILFERDRITIPVFEEGQDCHIRVSTHLYNTQDEVDHLIRALVRERQETG